MGRIESVRGAELFAPEETGGVSLEDVFTAYMDCRRKKRGTYNALAFEVDWERRCADLLGRINAGEYRPLRSLVFIIRKPVMREVFAPAFESRVVDHLIARKIEPLWKSGSSTTVTARARAKARSLASSGWNGTSGPVRTIIPAIAT